MTDAGRSISQTAKTAIFSQNTDECFIVLITIDNASFTDPIRVASDSYEVLPNAGVRGVVSRGNEFIFLPFSVELPQQDDTGIARASLSIDNVSREIVAAARSVTTPLDITIEVVLASDVDTVEVAIQNFKLDNVTYDALTISGDISVEYFELEPYPARRFTPSDFPGIF